MYLSDDDPASEATQETLTGYNTKGFRSYLINNKGLDLPYGYGYTRTYPGFNGLVGENSFTSIKWYAGSATKVPYIYFLQKDGTQVGKYKCDNFDGKYDSLPVIIFEKYGPTPVF